ncbi:LacI family DNA-binding transcriptional regulator [Alkaliphilus peptidifermentans]|uniref:Transcriptional regulator, LacI family n=1 Tax=Alkaliphilus peptidifermentans DSM 18978 TaxID=1120976 RepID=A0A1G5JNV7_9FIRM|nr:LacI family DNA-binding transcriptional regulator [Alkaliphilus peptidifermentans]SCY89581.1 transcriptional regulator, LacI family [Alkaliphilus peptidifermentans DSM 18978]
MSLRIKDVASQAGVSVATVSRVLNNSNSVKPETYEKVLQVIKEMQYKPNAIARSLKVKNTKTIGIMIPDISSYFFPEVVRGIEDVANMYDYNIILCNTDLNRDKEQKYLQVLTEKQVDGMIFMSNIITKELGAKLKSLQIPVVLVSTDYEDLPAVTIDNHEASKRMIEYLIEKGHDRIGMITGKEDDPIAGISRIEGYKKALQDRGREIDCSLIVAGDYRFNSGYQGGKKLLTLSQRPTAIFAASDEMAFGVIKAAAELKLAIPTEIAIAGFDDIDMSQKIVPSLTTIAQPMYNMGAVGMRLLTKILNGEDIETTKIVLDYSLVERETS